MANKEGQQIDTLPVQAYGLDGATIRKLAVDENGKVIVDPTGLDARYLKLDNATAPQILTATDTPITASDEVYFGDVTDSSKLKKDTVQGILDLVSTPIPQYDADPVSPTAEDAWVRRSPVFSSGSPFGFLFLLTATAITGYTYAFRYRNKEGSTVGVALT